jgi:hypothetical protein
VLPLRLERWRQDDGAAELPFSEFRRRPGPAIVRPRDVGAEADRWRNILLDQLRMRGANFYGI